LQPSHNIVCVCVCVCVLDAVRWTTELFWQSHFIKFSIYCFLQKRSQIVSLSVSQHASLRVCVCVCVCEARLRILRFVHFSLSNLRTFLLIVMKISEGWKPLNAFNLSKCPRRAFNMCAENSRRLMMHTGN